MKQTLKSIIRNVKSIKGNSLAEFATTTALMATLAATAAPKLSEMSEGTKAEKSRNEIDKIIKQGALYYQKTADIEGRGRFPGQETFRWSVGGPNGNYENWDASTAGNEASRQRWTEHFFAVDRDLGFQEDHDGFRNFWQQSENAWASVFGVGNVDAPLPDNVNSDSVFDHPLGAEVWFGDCFGFESLKSPFQDGHYVYTVLAGFGSGLEHFPPILVVGDIENMVDFNNYLLP